MQSRCCSARLPPQLIILSALVAAVRLTAVCAEWVFFVFFFWLGAKALNDHVRTRRGGANLAIRASFESSLAALQGTQLLSRCLSIPLARRRPEGWALIDGRRDCRQKAAGGKSSENKRLYSLNKTVSAFCRVNKTKGTLLNKPVLRAQAGRARRSHDGG